MPPSVACSAIGERCLCRQSYAAEYPCRIRPHGQDQGTEWVKVYGPVSPKPVTRSLQHPLQPSEVARSSGHVSTRDTT